MMLPVVNQFQEVPIFNFVPYLEVEMLLRWFESSPYRAAKQSFDKGNENELVNIYILRGNLQNSSNLEINLFLKYNYLPLASCQLVEFIKLQLLSCN